KPAIALPIVAAIIGIGFYLKIMTSGQITAARTLHTRPGPLRPTVRFWEWDCFAKYLIIKKYSQISTQFITFRHFSPKKCPIWGMGLFRSIPNGPPISTQFIIIRHIVANGGTGGSACLSLSRRLLPQSANIRFYAN